MGRKKEGGGKIEEEDEKEEEGKNEKGKTELYVTREEILVRLTDTEHAQYTYIQNTHTHTTGGLLSSLPVPST